MQTTLFETGETAVLSITECAGDLQLAGWHRPAVRIQGDEGAVECRQEGQTVMVTSRSDLRIDLPYQAEIRAQSVRGDVVCKRIQGDISLNSVSGDLILSRVGLSRVGQVSGDLAARMVDGDLTVETVMGDMSASNVSGDLQVGRVDRDLGVRDLLGSAQAVDVHGDIRLRTAFASGASLAFKSDGDIVARVPADADADLTMRSGRSQIRVKAPLADRTDTGGQVTGRLGDGGASVVLEAGRDIVLVAHEPDWQVGADVGVLGAEIGAAFSTEFADWAEEIASQVEARMARMGEELEAKLANIQVDVAAIDRQAARAAEKAAEQARRKVEAAAEKLRRRAEHEAHRARRKAERMHGRTGYVTGSRRATPEPPGEPVSDQERIAILNMLASGNISVDEAETLLDALNT